MLHKNIFRLQKNYWHTEYPENQIFPEMYRKPKIVSLEKHYKQRTKKDTFLDVKLMLIYTAALLWAFTIISGCEKQIFCVGKLMLFISPITAIYMEKKTPETASCQQIYSLISFSTLFSLLQSYSDITSTTNRSSVLKFWYINHKTKYHVSVTEKPLLSFI